MKNNHITSSKNRTRFSLRFKLMLFFGTLIIVSLFVSHLYAIKIAEKAVTEKVETHLIDKAITEAEIIEQKLVNLIDFIESIARNPALQDTSLSYGQRARALDREKKLNKYIKVFGICTVDGMIYDSDGRSSDISHRGWFKKAIKGEVFISKPLVSQADGSLAITIAVPIYAVNGSITGVLIGDIDGFWLTDIVKQIKVGKTGTCSIIDNNGVTLADIDEKLVLEEFNAIEAVKTNPVFKALGLFEQLVITSTQSGIGTYAWKGVKKIAGYTKMKTTGWHIIVYAPFEEFMGTIKLLRVSMIASAIIILIITLVGAFIVSHKIVVRVKNIANALQSIATGNFTIRLPVKGTDELADLSQYFNQAMLQIGNSIKTVTSNTATMTQVGQTLSTNMSETATSIHQISTNIDGVKEKVLNQRSSAKETSAAIEQIIGTINNLNTGIENQTASLEDLVAIVQESNNATNTTKAVLKKNNDLIAQLVQDASEGKDVIAVSEHDVKKIAEESGSLIEASGIIQNIASQTNLLAMNAAIEAAHAGEAGKGFAVVADEIRKLAEESSSQGKNITATLKNLSGEIETVSTSSINIGEKFMSIFEKVTEVKNMSTKIMKIAEAREEQSAELMQLINNVHSVTGDVQNGSSEMLKEGAQVVKEMQTLNELTKNITASMNEMAAGTMQINDAIQEVNNLTIQNKESIKNLSDTVSRFTV